MWRRRRPARRDVIRRRPEVPNPLRHLGFALAAVGVGATVVSFAFGGKEAINQLAPNVASESIGILLTLTVVQRLIDRTERWRRLRGSLGALRRSGRALTRFAELWAELVKGALPAAPERAPHGPEELFLPRYTESLVHLDPARRAAPGVFSIREAVRELTELAETLARVVATQPLALDVEYVELIDALVDDPFLELVRRLAEDERSTAREWTVRLGAARGDRETFFHGLVSAIECHNGIAAEAARVRNRRTAPRTGALGVELPLDFDLKVFLSLDGDWWRSAPAPATLRATPRAGAARLVL